jgi:hypothetical protein
VNVVASNNKYRIFQKKLYNVIPNIIVKFFLKHPALPVKSQ